MLCHFPFIPWEAARAQNDRVARVGRDLKDHLVTTPCHGQGNHPLGQVAQSGPEHLQGWDPLRARPGARADKESISRDREGKKEQGTDFLLENGQVVF